jgi:hypothetical protein
MAPLEKIRFLAERPALDYGLLLEVGMQALRTGEPYNLNPENWGYADVELEESPFPANLAVSGHAAARDASVGG